jgi:hypothetical protein
VFEQLLQKKQIAEDERLIVSRAGGMCRATPPKAVKISPGEVSRKRWRSGVDAGGWPFAIAAAILFAC